MNHIFRAIVIVLLASYSHVTSFHGYGFPLHRLIPKTSCISISNKFLNSVLLKSQSSNSLGRNNIVFIIFDNSCTDFSLQSVYDADQRLLDDILNKKYISEPKAFVLPSGPKIPFKPVRKFYCLRI